MWPLADPSVLRTRHVICSDFQSERSSRAVQHCGLWFTLFDNDLIGSLVSQNGHGDDLLLLEIDIGALSIRISAQEDNVYAFSSRQINQILLC